MVLSIYMTRTRAGKLYYNTALQAHETLVETHR